MVSSNVLPLGDSGVVTSDTAGAFYGKAQNYAKIKRCNTAFRFGRSNGQGQEYGATMTGGSLLQCFTFAIFCGADGPHSRTKGFFARFYQHCASMDFAGCLNHLVDF